MHVAIVHDTKIPTSHYGGTERVVWWLAKALVKLNHRVTLIVPKGSTCDFASIIERPSNDPRINPLIPKDVNIVHTSSTLHEKISKPFLSTIHGNGQVGEKFHSNSVFISKDHASRHNSSAFVYNGLDIEEYPEINPALKENFCYFLAKASWGIKNVRGAIKISKLAKKDLKIVGGYRPTLGKRVKWLGMLGGEKKNEILKKGSALINPVLWCEPFGLSIIEALLTGSPVFGTPYGSLPELIGEEYGFLSTSSAKLAGALQKSDEYNSETCRKYILEKFTNIHMANSYLNYYEHILSGKLLSKEEPKTLSKESPEKKLFFN